MTAKTTKVRTAPRGKTALVQSLEELGFAKAPLGGGTEGYVRVTDASIITIVEAEGVACPTSLDDAVTVTIDANHARRHDGSETIAEFAFGSLRAALEAMRLF